MEKKLQKITVSGIVQGVWFRKSTKSEADRLGVQGTVRNLSDGSVYIEAEGTAVQLEELVAWCHQGPPRARVDSVNVESGEPKHFHAFSITK